MNAHASPLSAAPKEPQETQSRATSMVVNQQSKNHVPNTNYNPPRDRKGPTQKGLNQEEEREANRSTKPKDNLGPRATLNTKWKAERESHMSTSQTSRRAIPGQADHKAAIPHVEWAATLPGTTLPRAWKA
ncbi:hypothetical protein NDU88_001674 [Pleurodeles waltl]|uniref:Uncharacterized protein n=1 Tax=Pleurodeles waltl TaxID=8319 RepID=A0AAV7T040_PLEWA|nr:hypothetical protein NDU88_001674 [Pleurodeles waltl]